MFAIPNTYSNQGGELFFASYTMGTAINYVKLHFIDKLTVRQLSKEEIDSSDDYEIVRLRNDYKFE